MSEGGGLGGLRQQLREVEGITRELARLLAGRPRVDTLAESRSELVAVALEETLLR